MASGDILLVAKISKPYLVIFSGFITLDHKQKRTLARFFFLHYDVD